jgi:membrane-anchored protein YejM (alkaline phosphatase superfamily)
MTIRTSTTTKTTTALHDPPAPVRAKLAAAWTSFMFFLIYVDYLHLYKPGIIDDFLAGVVFKFVISQTFVVIALMLVGIPSLMILLSTTLPARANRTLNLVVASLYIPVSAFNVAGGSWMLFYGLGVVLEVILLAYILRSAWTWPRTSSLDEGQ